MQLTQETRLQDLVDAYPWLIDYGIARDSRLKIAKTAIGRAMIRRSNIADASRLSGYPVDEILAALRQVIEEHEATQKA